MFLHLQNLLIYVCLKHARANATGNYILQFLSSHQSLESFVSTAIYQVFGCLTVLGWFISPEFQNVHDDVSRFLAATPSFQKTGIELLIAAVMEMNYSSSSLKKLSKHRKTGRVSVFFTA